MSPEHRAGAQGVTEHANRPTTVAPSTRVTVAFPFSTVKIHESDDRWRALAAIVCDLAAQVAALEPSPAAQDLQARARAFAAELAS